MDDPPPPPPTWLPQRRPDQGAVLLRDHPGEVVRLDCRECSRAERYALAWLVERFGPAAGLSDVLAALSADCLRRRNWRQSGGPCGAHFRDLVPPRPAIRSGIDTT